MDVFRDGFRMKTESTAAKRFVLAGLIGVLALSCQFGDMRASSAALAQQKKKAGKTQPPKQKKQPAGKKKDEPEEVLPKISDLLENLPRPSRSCSRKNPSTGSYSPTAMC
jgi:hypothetical protein